MDYTDFYWLTDKDIRNAVCVSFAQDIDDWNVLRGINPLPEGALCYPYMGKRYYDIIIPSRPFPFLISDKIIDAFARNNITGWKATSVKIVGKEELKYYVLMVTGRCGYIDCNKSEKIIQKSPGGEDWPFLRGLYFEPESWDGTDIFVADNMSFIICKEKVKKILESIKATNVSYEKITDLTLEATSTQEEVMNDMIQGKDDKWSELIRTINKKVDEELRLHGFAINKR